MSLNSLLERRRVAVYAREYKASENWTIEHGLPGDDVFVQAMNDDFNTIIPRFIQNVEEGVIRINTTQPTTGWVSVFELAPLFNHQKIMLNNFTVGTFKHKYGHQKFLTQFWDTEGYTVYPKTCQKLDNETIFFEFHEAFDGYAILITNVNIKKVFEQEKEWSVNHWILKARTNIIMQEENFLGEMIIPQNEKRIDENIEYTTDNVIESTFLVPVSGTSYGIAYGINI